MPETDAPEAVEADQPVTDAPAQDKATETDPLEQLKQVKAEARKWEQRAKENMAKLKEAEPKISEYDRLIEASKSDLERKAEEASRWQQEAERWRTASVSSRIQALATRDFTDPNDAVDKLAQSGKYLDAGGTIDDKAIQADLDALLEERPHYRRKDPEAAPKTPRPPAPNPHQGSGGGSKPAADPRQEFAALLQGALHR